MNVFVKFNEIPSMILQVIKETKRYRLTFVRSDGRSFVRSDGQRENSIPSHKHSLRGYNYLSENLGSLGYISMSYISHNEVN